MNRSSSKGFVSETPIRVRYAETDAMRVAHHSSYVVWLEAGRTDWMRQRGSSYAAFEAAGYALPVIELQLRYVAPARYDDLVTVRTWVDEVKSRLIRFGYEVIGKDGTLLANGTTTHVCTTADGQATSIPPFVRQILEMAVDRPPRVR